MRTINYNHYSTQDFISGIIKIVLRSVDYRVSILISFTIMKKKIGQLKSGRE